MQVGMITDASDGMAERKKKDGRKKKGRCAMDEINCIGSRQKHALCGRYKKAQVKQFQSPSLLSPPLPSIYHLSHPSENGCL
jgi:hypothetical protein